LNILTYTLRNSQTQNSFSWSLFCCDNSEKIWWWKYVNTITKIIR
jgi:hypothetical protein